MEEILSSIKRIIAEEGDGTPQRIRRQPRAATASQPVAGDEPELDDFAGEVLELSDPMPPPRNDPARTEPAPRPARAAAIATSDAILSPETLAASRGALDNLGRMMVKPEPGSDGSIEGLVRELLRPMLREWLDANLPQLVETMVAREIKRITAAGD